MSQRDAASLVSSHRELYLLAPLVGRPRLVVDPNIVASYLREGVRVERITAVERVYLNDIVGECPLPPEGWSCSRGRGHKGPCAASRTDGSSLDEWFV